MGKYKVKYEVAIVIDGEIEAEDEDEAYDIARNNREAIEASFKEQVSNIEVLEIIDDKGESVYVY